MPRSADLNGACGVGSLAFELEVDRPEMTVRASAQVEAGKVLALLGPSGAGKSTVLEAIGGLVDAKFANISLGERQLMDTRHPGRNVAKWQRSLGLLRQESDLFAHLSVEENVFYSKTSQSSETYGRWLMERLEITELQALKPGRISGGQARRVALARVLASQPNALLLDEPFGALDTRLSEITSDLIAEIAHERQIPVLLVVHELYEAQRLGDRLAIMHKGTIVQEDEPHVVMDSPAEEAVAVLMGYGPFVAGSYVGLDGDVSIGLHPQRARLLALCEDQPDSGSARAELNALQLAATVVATRPYEGGWEADLESPAGRLRVRGQRQHALHPGAKRLDLEGTPREATWNGRGEPPTGCQLVVDLRRAPVFDRQGKLVEITDPALGI